VNAMHVDALDHSVLCVRDVGAAIALYERVSGMEVSRPARPPGVPDGRGTASPPPVAF